MTNKMLNQTPDLNSEDLWKQLDTKECLHVHMYNC